MTKNQLEYWKNQEQIRSNLAQETETNRANMAREAETHRANLQNEAHLREMDRQAEMNRLQNERLKLRDQELTAKSQSEVKRANLSRELENSRSRVEGNQIRRREASTANYNALTNRMQAEELKRSHLAQESYNLTSLAEIKRANEAREAELLRSNVANEGIRRDSNIISARNLEETRRSNMQREALQARGQDLQLVANLADVGGRMVTTQMTNTSRTRKGKIKLK